MNGTKITRYTSRDGSKAIFIPLPVSEWRVSCSDGFCGCDVCKKDGDLTLAFWDTLVVSPDAPKKGENDYASVCHYPELHSQATRIQATEAYYASQALSPISPIDPKHLDAVIAGTVPADEGTATLAEREAVERFKASHTIAWQ